MAHTRRTQTLLSIAGVAVAIALLLVVTAIGLGMLTESTVSAEKTDYWIVPEGSASSAVTATDGPRLGNVHQGSDRIRRMDGVTSATPLLMEMVPVTSLETSTAAASENATLPATSTYVIAIGVVPSTEQTTVSGLPTAPLVQGDPYYANGSYQGQWTGEAVVAESAARALNISVGDGFTVAGQETAEPRTFTVNAVSKARTAGMGQLPVVIVHLSELQSVTGADQGDMAGQILVATTERQVKTQLATVYPQADVVTRRGLLAQQAEHSQLPVAMSLSALAVAVVVGTLFVVTTMGFEVAAGSHERAVLAAMGVSAWSRTTIVALEALTVALLGGVSGVVLALGGVVLTNALAKTFMTELAIAVFRPVLAAYGIAVALAIGLLTLPYLLVVGRRTTTTEALTP